MEPDTESKLKVELSLGAIEIHYTDFLGIRPGTVLELPIPEPFEVLLRQGGVDFAVGRLTLIEGAMQLSVKEFISLE